MSRATDARRERIYQWLHAYIADEGISPSILQVARAVGMAHTTVKGHLDGLRDAGRVTFQDGRLNSLWIPGMMREPIRPLNVPGGPGWRGWREATAEQ